MKHLFFYRPLEAAIQTNHQGAWDWNCAKIIASDPVTLPSRVGLRGNKKISVHFAKELDE